MLLIISATIGGLNYPNAPIASAGQCDGTIIRCIRIKPMIIR